MATVQMKMAMAAGTPVQDVATDRANNVAKPMDSFLSMLLPSFLDKRSAL